MKRYDKQFKKRGNTVGTKSKPTDRGNLRKEDEKKTGV